MTDEEMAIDWIRSQGWNEENLPSDELPQMKKAFLAGLKEGRPDWHKVADGDLPKKVDDYVTNIGVLTYDDYGNGVHKWHTPYCEACDYADEVGDDEVTAWCEIPKYTEE